MKERTITAFLMAALMIPILVFGHYFYLIDIFAGLLAFYGTYEVARVFNTGKRFGKIVNFLTAFAAIDVYLVILAQARFGLDPIWILYLIIAYFAFFGTLMVFVDEFKAVDFANQLVAILFGSIGFATFAILRDKSLMIVLYLLIVAIFTDTFAYLFGIKFGKHRLAPLVSPKKSIEGAVAGLVFGALFASAFALGFSIFEEWHFTTIAVVLLSLALSVVGQMGDLFKSKLKRSYNVKDFSNLFPGHGGILDRFDSLVFISLVMYLLLNVLGTVWL